LAFWLETAIHAPFWGVFGGYFPHMTLPIILTPKRHFLGRKHVNWAIQRKNRCDGSTWARDREKKQYNQKSHIWVIFPLFGGNPPFGRFDPKVARWVMSASLSRVPSFRLKSSWVTILQGVKFSIFLLILAWALQQCSATALPVIYVKLVTEILRLTWHLFAISRQRI